MCFYVFDVFGFPAEFSVISIFSSWEELSFRAALSLEPCSVFRAVSAVGRFGFYSYVCDLGFGKTLSHKLSSVSCKKNLFLTFP